VFPRGGGSAGLPGQAIHRATQPGGEPGQEVLALGRRRAGRVAEDARDSFGLLPWTLAAEWVRYLRMPPKRREHSMPGFSHSPSVIR